MGKNHGTYMPQWAVCAVVPGVHQGGCIERQQPIGSRPVVWHHICLCLGYGCAEGCKSCVTAALRL